MKYSEIESQAPQKKSCLDVSYRWIILMFIMWLTFGIYTSSPLACSACRTPMSN
jgi:hypothetical protein